MSVRFRVCLVLPWLLTLCTAAGCGDAGHERAEVLGKVTFDGAPVESGSIALIPAQGTIGPSVGGAISGGAYRIARSEGPCLGPHRVEIRATRQTGRQVAAGEGASDPNAMIDEVEMFIPEKYHSNSTLTADIKAGVNEFNFDLTGDDK
ncbi:MAG: hypothetical protein GX575_22185 [Candidatus Anammoximicrobium sp.]|nr:hypothetical protein [Candidatus Anammoximicrobium sp.]